MKYKYYGTAAAEGIPALWCECDTCKRARAKRGKNIMSRSQQVIDDKILIDFSADTFMHTTQGLDLTQIHTCIITHAHADHLYPEDFTMRAKWFATLKKEIPLNIYVTAPGVEMIKTRFIEQNSLEITMEKVTVNEIYPFKSFVAEGYKITPLTADHSDAMGSVIFLIEKDEKCVLHAHDTGYFREETWEYLKNNAVHLDFVSFDCTEIEKDKDDNKITNHMNLSTINNVRKKLTEMGLIDEKTICAVNHFSHNCHYIYDEIKEIAEKEGLITSYDGMEVTF